MAIRILTVFFVLFAISGCKTELYGGLSEKEGNEMFAILYNAGIEIDKQTNKDRLVTLLVEESHSATAIHILKNHGYPKEQFTNIGDVFSKDGLISSPTEEKARLIYALSQEISSTLSQIDGVLTARVHVVMPEKSEYGKKPEPPSASVFIKHSSETNLTNLITQIKQLVANSINGLSDKQVSVALFPSIVQDTNIVSKGISAILQLVIALGVVALILVSGWFGYKKYQSSSKRKDSTISDENRQPA